MKNNVMVLLCGPSACGKGTYLSNLPKTIPGLIVSYNTLKIAFYQSEAKGNCLVVDEDNPTMSEYERAWEYANINADKFKDYANVRIEKAFKLAVNENKTIFIDNTNLTPKARAPWVKLAREHGMHIHAIEFWIEYKTIMERQKTRLDKLIPLINLKQQIRAQTYCAVGTEVDTVEFIRY